MSLNQRQSDAEQGEHAAAARKRRGSFDEQRRMSSITRRLHWYMLRGKIARFIITDLLLFVLLAFGWCAGQEYAALGMVFSGNTRSFEVVQTAAEPGVDLIYRVASKEGTLLLSASSLVPLIVISSGAAGIMIVPVLAVLID